MKNLWSEMDAATGELVITNQDTPFNWDNRLFNRKGDFYALVSQRGMGKVYYNFERNEVAEGRNYLLADGSGQTWSLNGGEAPCQAAKSLVRQMPGVSVFETEHNGVNSSLTVAIDPDATVEGNLLTLTNTSAEAKDLLLTGCYFIRLLGLDNSQQLDRTAWHPEESLMTLRRYHAESAHNRYAAFYTTDLPADSFCGSMEDFLGGDIPFHRAAAFRQETLPPVHACATVPIFALRHKLTLAAGQSVTISYTAGICDTLENAEADGRKWRGKAEEVIANALAFEAETLSCGSLKCPDEKLNVAYNVWTKEQLLAQCRSRRGGMSHNWRNNLQDGDGAMLFDTKYLRENLLLQATLVQKDGFVPRQSPKTAGALTALGQVYAKQRHNDIGTWYAAAAADYILETGDFAILDEKVYNENHGREITLEEAVVGGLIWTLSQRGMHGLVRFIDGDWSDPLEKAGRNGIGESVWTSVAACRSVRMLAPVLRAAGRNAIADRLEAGAAELKDSINRNAWDGGWYIRGITDAGVKFCTAADPDANCSMLVQAWSLMGHVAEGERAEKVAHELKTRCLTEFGPVLYAPPFLTERDGIGRESAKQPGCGENGSCYTHGSMMYAAAMLEIGDPDMALRILRLMVPSAEDDVCRRRWMSPLWWCNYYQSPHAVSPGRGSNIISSGAPAWFYMNIAGGLFGLKPQLDGLRVAPQFPSAWNEAELTRLWRGAEYHVTVKRTGKPSISLDGKKIDGNLLPPPKKPGEKHEVVVEI